MKIPFVFTASLIALCSASPVIAQEAGEEEKPEIVVTGEGLEPALSNIVYSTANIERDSIVSSGSGRLDDVLANVAGFQQFRRSDSRSANPTAQGVTLRALSGNATSRALVLLDGCRLPIRSSAIFPCPRLLLRRSAISA